MDQINYVGEHLWAGKLGHFIVLATFISSILSAVSYYFFVKKRGKRMVNTWQKCFYYSFGSCFFCDWINLFYHDKKVL